MDNKSFDDIIKNKLDQYSLEIDSNSWDLFQDRQLDAGFDDVVKSQMQDHTLEEMPTDFEDLAAKLPSGFDAIVGAKLAEMTVDATPDWDKFERILEEDIIFDSKVSKTVESYEAPVSESQWPKLAEHLERVEKRRRRIVITKFIEAAVFLLFILTLMQLSPIQTIAKKQVYRTFGVTQDLYANAQKGEINKKQVTVEEDVARQVAESKISASVVNIDRKEIPTLAVNEGRSFVYRERRATNILPTLVISELEVGKDKAFAGLFRKDDRFYNDLKAFESRPFIDDQLLATLDIKDVTYEDRQFSFPGDDLSSLLKREQYWFNVYGAPEVNLISTPYDKSYSDLRFIDNEQEAIDAYSHLTEGYSVGASISKETANLEIEGGIEYTSLNYFPKQIKVVTGKSTTGLRTTILKEIIFDIIEIPVNLKYSIYNKKGWNLYGSNGLSAGIVAFSTYDIDETTSKPLAALEVLGNSRSVESTFGSKEFNPGFFQGGELQKNGFLTLSAGIGVSKEISDRIAFYVQPTYHHNLSQSGLGPNNDVHHRLSLQIGTKVRI